MPLTPVDVKALYFFPLLNSQGDGSGSARAASWILNLQSLIALYHLNEGVGTVAKDYAPVETPQDGTITNGSWVQGPATKLLTFAGTGYVDCGVYAAGVGIDFNVSTKFSIGLWFSPSELEATERLLADKSGQFSLGYVGLEGNGKFRFTFTDSANTPHQFDSDPGIVYTGAKLFVVITYDGATVSMYVNGNLHKTFSQTGAPHTSSSHVYIGNTSKGVIAEAMFWQRCLISQEVLELYFFPLFRVVKKGGGATAALTGDAAVGDVAAAKTFYNTNPLSKLTGTLALTGDADEANVAAGKTFYKNDLYTKKTGTLPTVNLTGNAQPGDVLYGQTFYNTDPANKLTGILRAFLRGFQIVQTLTHSIRTPTDHVIQQTRSVVYKAPTDHVMQMTRSLTQTLYASKWFVDVCSVGADRGSTDHEGLNAVDNGVTLTVVATPYEAGGCVIPKVNPFRLDNTYVGSCSDTAASYTIAAQTVNTVHKLKVNWLVGFIARGDANTTLNGYNTYVHGAGVSWSSVGSPGSGKHWEFYWNGVDVGTSSGTRYANDGTENTASCVAVNN